MVHKKKFLGAGCGLLVMMASLTVLLSPPGDAIRAFNQTNLIRVSEMREVDGKLFYQRVAPVSEFLP